MYLENINNPSDLKHLSYRKKRILAKEIRAFLINLYSNNSMHLSSNLGVVELTIALHSVFDVPEDKVFFDTGHQSYVHKILTGRKDQMHTIKKPNGISSFQDMNESKYDVYSGGHSSNSISVALGMATNLKDKHYAVPVIGDAAISNGLAFEALNDLINHQASKKMIIILNDNGMSISKNVGALAIKLANTKTRKINTKLDHWLKQKLSKNKFGKKFEKILTKIVTFLKNHLFEKSIFEDLGIKYLGPINGHKIKQVENALRKAKLIEGPVVIHVKTIKGKGIPEAELDVSGKYHSTNQKYTFNYYDAVSRYMFELASVDKKVHVINPAMTFNTGYSEFANKLSSQYHDVGIAEGHALSLASGMALAQLRPYVHIYSTFLQRAYDQLVHDINRLCLPVVLLIDRAGFSSSDGKTHNGTLDIAFLNTLSNFSIMSPSNDKELEWMLNYSQKTKAPLAIRFANVEMTTTYQEKKITFGKWLYVIKNGAKKLIITYGEKVNYWKDRIEASKEEADLVNALFIKPVDIEFIKNEINKYDSYIVDESVEGNNNLEEAIKLVLYK